MQHFRICLVVALVVLSLYVPASAQVSTSVDPWAQQPVETDLQTAIKAGHVQRVPATADGLPVDGLELPKIEKAVDAVDDPPGLLADNQLGSLKELAVRLSADRSWMRPEIFTTLGFQDLHLDEIFVDAPEVVRFESNYYRIQVEKVGPMWEGFQIESDPYFVFLTHEIYDGLGDDRALAYLDGDETVIFETDFQKTPALAVTLVKLPPSVKVTSFEKIVALESSFDLGAAELRLPVERLPIHLFPELQNLIHLATNPGLEQNTTCTQAVAPTSCSNGRPVCGTGYKPYFVLTSLMIKTDHEGCCFKGNPEIELFPLRIDVASQLGSNTTASTNLLFKGASTTDMAGRTRYLPDVNNTNTWYNVTNGLAIFPADLGNELSALLVEDDDDTGVLRVNANKVNVTKLLKSVSSLIFDSRSIDLSFLVKLGRIILDIIGIFNDGDDLYQESLGVANNLFCTNSLGQMKTYHLISQEWEMKGNFACINPSCPDPSTGGGGGGGGGCLTLGDNLVACP